MLYKFSVAQIALFLVALILMPVPAAAQGGSGELPGSKPAPRPRREVASVITAITLDKSIESRLDPRTSDKIAAGNFFQEYDWKAAQANDLYSLKLQTEDPNIVVQIFDKENVEVPLSKDTSGNWSVKTNTGGLPADGDYIVRVSGRIGVRKAVPYTLTVARQGLLPAIYNERFQNIILKFRESDPASVDETLTRLDELAAEDDYKPSALEFIGIIQLYNKGDFEKAEKAMERAIKANGAAVLRIYHDKQWRSMIKGADGKLNFQETQTGWIRIRPGRLVISDYSNRTLATLENGKVTEVLKIESGDSSLVSVAADGAPTPYIFMPGTKQAAEADIVIRLIQKHVVGGAN